MSITEYLNNINRFGNEVSTKNYKIYANFAYSLVLETILAVNREIQNLFFDQIKSVWPSLEKAKKYEKHLNNKNAKKEKNWWCFLIIFVLCCFPFNKRKATLWIDSGRELLTATRGVPPCTLFSFSAKHIIFLSTGLHVHRSRLI